MTVVEFQLRHTCITIYIPYPSRGNASAWNNSFVRTLSADLCASTCGQNGFFTSKDLFQSSSVVLVSTYCQSGILTSVSESESTVTGASTDDK